MAALAVDPPPGATRRNGRLINRVGNHAADPTVGKVRFEEPLRQVVRHRDRDGRLSTVLQGALKHSFEVEHFPVIAAL